MTSDNVRAVSAAIFNVTDLTSYLSEVESLGEEGRHLVERPRALIRNYDMEAISKILSEVQQR